MDGACLIGDVEIGSESSVWFNCVLRGDINRVVVGRMTNIQDLTICHVDDHIPCLIGDQVTVGHSSRIHACTIGNRVLIGMGATLLDGAVIEDDTMIAEGALVPPGMVVPSGMLAVGVPAKITRPLTPDEREANVWRAEKYARLIKSY
jgi:carbonic anhydrase/acetyltransferase-like protein (isoleucine patch superfamily)